MHSKLRLLLGVFEFANEPATSLSRHACKHLQPIADAFVALMAVVALLGGRAMHARDLVYDSQTDQPRPEQMRNLCFHYGDDHLA